MNRIRKVIPVFTSFFTALVLLWIFLSQDFSGAYWTRWYPLLIPADQVSSVLVKQLKEVSSQLVYGDERLYNYNGLGEEDSISGSQLESGQNLMDNDPRLDPFLRNVNRYFKGDLYEFFYLPADRSSIKYRNGLKKLWQNDWILPDFSWDGPVLFLAAILSVFMLIRAGRQFVPVLFMTVLIAGNLYLGDNGFLMPGVLILFLLSQYRQPAKYRIFLTILIPLGEVLFLLNGSISLKNAAAVLLIFISGMAVPLSPLKRKEKKRHDRGIKGKLRDHELFLPVSLTSRNLPVIQEVSRRFGRELFLVFVQTGLAVILFFLVLTGDRHFPISFPAASIEKESPWTYDSLDKNGREGRIPGVTDMLIHRAYQDSFSFGGTWMMPRMDNTVNLETFSLEEGKIVSTIKPVLVFDQAWFDRFFIEMDQEGPGVLLRSEPYLPDISYTNLIARTPRKGDLALSGILLFLGILLSLMNWAASPVSGSEDFRMRNHLLLLRRKQQAA